MVTDGVDDYPGEMADQRRYPDVMSDEQRETRHIHRFEMVGKCSK